MNTLTKEKTIVFPVICLIFYLVAEYAKIQILGPLQLALVAQIALVICFAGKINKIKEIVDDNYFKYYLVLLLIMASHVFFARNNYWAYMQIRLMVTYLIVGISFCLFLNTEKKIYLFVSVYIFIHLIAALSWIFGWSFMGHSGVLGDENDIALAMNVVMPISFFLGLGSRGVKRYCFWGSAIVFIMANTVAGSRGGFVGLACTAVFCMLFLKTKMKGLIILCISVAVFWVSIPDSYKNRIYSIKSETSQETGSTGYGRMQVWRLALNVFGDFPLIGVGQGNIPWYLGDYIDVNDSDSYWNDKPGQGGRQSHSVYFTILPELGLIGTLLFALMIRNVVGKVKDIKAKSVNDENILKYMSFGLVVGMIGYLTSGIFLSALYYPQFWNISALILAVYSLYKKQYMETCSKIEADKYDFYVNELSVLRTDYKYK